MPSPSARKVWIEIDAFTSPIGTNLMSPSARKVWIEIQIAMVSSLRGIGSPSARKVWIEIILQMSFLYAPFVTFREEGVD